MNFSSILVKSQCGAIHETVKPVVTLFASVFTFYSNFYPWNIANGGYLQQEASSVGYKLWTISTAFTGHAPLLGKN